MDWNTFWHTQTTKNETGRPTYIVTTDPGTPEQEFMDKWIEKWSQHFSYFVETGCGCCYNSYELDAPEAALKELMDEIPDFRVERYADANRPMKSGTPSNFRAFSRQLNN